MLARDDAPMAATPETVSPSATIQIRLRLPAGQVEKLAEAA
jgi:hypothetical protein